MVKIPVIKVRRSDVFWGYLAQLFTIATGLLVLPLVLRLLTKEEIGFNYLMITLSGLVNLLDFGFSRQFSRNFSYVFGGIQKLQKEGFAAKENENISINYHLLLNLIYSAKIVYKRISTIALIFLLSVGSIYIYKATSGFSIIDNALIIWIIYSISIFFNIYYTYYNSLVRGRGLISQLNKITIYGRTLQLFLNVTLLYMGFGLLGLAIGNFIYPFFTRYLLYHVFYDSEMKNNLSKEFVEKEESIELFKTIWFNTKKLGLVFIGSYVINKVSIFIAGLYLTLPQIASYGLMIQLFGYIVTIGSTVFGVFQPRLSSLRISNSKMKIIKEFSLSMGIFYLLFIFGALSLLFVAPFLLQLIGSNITLPAREFLVVYALVLFLENNHSFFASLIVTGNIVPFVKPSLISGGAIILGILLSFEIFGANYWAMILVPGIVQLSYNNWKWPIVVFKEFEISFIEYVKLVITELLDIMKQTYERYQSKPI